jgi:hypothetical protein
VVSGTSGTTIREARGSTAWVGIWNIAISLIVAHWPPTDRGVIAFVLSIG